MDIELLRAVKLFMDQSGQKQFLGSCFRVLTKHGLAKGFRQTSWWGNPICMGQLSQLFTTNEGLFRSVLPSIPKSVSYASREEMLADRQKLSDYFHATYGAPEFPADNSAGESLFSPEFDAWLKEQERIGNPDVFRDVHEKLPSVLVTDIVILELHKAAKKTFDEFCRDLWTRIAVMWRGSPEVRLFNSYFPIPEDMLASFDMAPEEDAAEPEAAEPAATPDEPATPAAPADAEPASVVDLAEVAQWADAFREARSCDLARRIGAALTKLKWYGAAEAYYAQARQMAPSGAEAEIAREFCLATCRAGIVADAAAEAKSFRELNPGAPEGETIEAEIGAAKRESEAKEGRLPIWTEDDARWGDTDEARRNAVRREAAALIEKGDRLQALEFLTGAMLRRPFTDAAILRQLMQVMMSLKLTYIGAQVGQLIVMKDPKKSSRADALERTFDCLLAEGSCAEAQEVLESLSRCGVKKARLKAMAARLAAMAPQAAPDAPVTDEKPAAEPVASAAPAPAAASSAYSTDARPKLDHVPYPREYIGFIRHRAGHVNFEVAALKVKGKWLRLLTKEAEALFPRFGALSLRFANAKDSVSLKEDHLCHLTVDRSELRSTGDPDFTVAIDARSGQQFKPLSAVGGVILVEPADKAFDLTFDTEVTLDGRTAECAVLDNESALVAVEGGYAGPFKLRASGRSRLYLPKVSLKDLSAVPLRRPAADAILSLEVPAGGGTAPCRIAFMDGRAAKVTTDLVRDGSLLQAAAREIPTLPAAGDVRALLAASDVLADPKRQQRLLSLLNTLGETDRFAGELRDLAVRKLVTVLKAESTALEHPVTDAVVKAVTNTDDLKALAVNLTREREAVEAKHQAALAAEEKVFADRRKALRDELAALEGDVAAAEAAGKAKKAFWDEELSRIVTSAKTAISQHALSPYFTDLPEAPGGVAKKAAVASTDARDFAARAAAMTALPAVRKSSGDIRRHLIRAFQARRGYTHDETVNLFVSLANNFLTLFSGEPGCGKTSACGILADALGLTDLAPRLADAPAWQGAASCDRFLAVPVERGWTSKRDFLGYFNPLTQSFSASDRRRYEAFRLLSEETGSPDAFPFVFLLDEANLSPMEYYWADFMGICGGDARASREIVLGDSVLCRIPDHLRFLATVNIDDTTEPLSPRLLDRAWIIRLPDPEFNPATVSGAEPAAVRWKDFTAAFGASGPVVDVKEMQPYYEHMRAMGLTVSMRSRRAIAQFIAVGTPLFDGGLATAVDYAVAQKLLPMVRGSGAAFQAWLETFRALCEKAPVSAGIVDHILTRGGSNLNFFQFF